MGGEKLAEEITWPHRLGFAHLTFSLGDLAVCGPAVPRHLGPRDTGDVADERHSVALLDALVVARHFVNDLSGH